MRIKISLMPKPRYFKKLPNSNLLERNNSNKTSIVGDQTH